jgi:hypothetical protein
MIAVMTQQFGISILAAPLAAVDRRALSQAWYSALHLARTSSQEMVVAQPRRSSPASQRAILRSIPTSAAGSTPAASESKFGSKTHTLRRERDVDALLRGRSSLARQIEKTFVHSGARVRRATFSIGRGGARVHVVLATKGNAVILVALCRPEVRSAVARALVQVRAALAARGIGIDVTTKGSLRCS